MSAAITSSAERMTMTNLPPETAAKLDALFDARQAALAAWDATAYNAADAQISAIRASLNAEVNLGQRVAGFFTRTLRRAGAA